MVKRKPAFARRVRQLRNCRIDRFPVAKFLEPGGFTLDERFGEVIHAAVADVGREIEVHAGHFVKKQALTGLGERQFAVVGFGENIACEQYVNEYADGVCRQSTGTGGFVFGVLRF